MRWALVFAGLVALIVLAGAARLLWRVYGPVLIELEDPDPEDRYPEDHYPTWGQRLG